MMRVVKIISGGQTGADRAGLDAAMVLGICHSGYCPAGRLAEDGIIPSCYQLEETISKKYPARTKANIRTADLTLIFYIDNLEGGSLHTKVLAEKFGKPYLTINLADSCDIGPEIEKRYPQLGDVIINIAGPRASSHPDIYLKVYNCLHAFLLELKAK